MTTLTPKDCFVEVRGLRTHYIDYGGDGPVLLGLPGLVQTARAFASIAPLLVPHVRLIALDFRGRGGTDWCAPENYRFDQYLRDVREFINLMQFQNFGLIGSSLGGFVARTYATAYPARVSRLILNDCAIGGSVAGLFHVGARPASAPEEFATFSDAIDWFLATRQGLDRLSPEIREEYVSHYVRPTETGGFRFDCDPAVIRTAKGLVDQLSRLPRTEVESQVAWEQASRLKMPFLLIRGELSDVISAATVSRLREVLPHAQSVEVTGVGHSPTLYEPEVQEALASFFQIDGRKMSAEAA